MNDSSRPSFDLIEQPWLTARTLEGEPVELSLVDLFASAHRLERLTGEVATQVFAVTRLLVAVLHGAVGGPRDLPEWADLWQAEELPIDAVKSYLDRHRARFELFHEKTPFLQVAGLRTDKGELSDPRKLVADVPNGRPFFCTRMDSSLSLSFAEAARWLVHCHAFDPSGIKSGASDDPRVKNGKGYPIGAGWSGGLGGVLPEGATVRETLLLNLMARDFGQVARPPQDDLAAWEREPVHGEVDVSREPTGPVDLYTWQSRRVRLAAEGGRVVGVLICNGDPCPPHNRQTTEPHSGWRRSEPQEKKLRKPVVYMPLQHAPERMVWRGLQSLLPGAAKPQDRGAAARLSPEILEWVSTLTESVLGQDYVVHLRTIGMVYGSNNSVTDEIIDDALSLHAVLLRQDAQALVEVAVSGVAAAEAAARALGSLAADLALAAGGEADGPRTRAVELAYAELDVLFRRWLGGLTADSDATGEQATWHRTVRDVLRGLAADLFARAAPSAWSGRTVNQRRLTSAHAITWFHRALRRALPLAYAPSREGATE